MKSLWNPLLQFKTQNLAEKRRRPMVAHRAAVARKAVQAETWQRHPYTTSAPTGHRVCTLGILTFADLETPIKP